MSDNPLPDGITRHPDLWMDDGNIVLVADKMAFRVHRSILAKHSDVFRGMFSVPQPPSDVSQDSETIEGCPMVNVPDEDPEALAVVLGILYDGGARFYDRSVVLPFRTVIWALLSSSKFQIDHIRNEALRRLRVCFPSDADKMCRLAQYYSTRELDDVGPETGYCQMDAISMAEVAGRLELKEMLPAALYHCAQIPLPILSAAARDRSRPRSHRLSSETLMVCVTFTFETQLLFNYLLDPFFSSDPMAEGYCAARISSGNLPPPLPCTLGLREVFIRAYAGSQLHVSSDPLAALANLPNGSQNDKLCPQCVSRLERQIGKAKKAIWRELYEMFGPDPATPGPANEN